MQMRFKIFLAFMFMVYFIGMVSLIWSLKNHQPLSFKAMDPGNVKVTFLRDTKLDSDQGFVCLYGHAEKSFECLSFDEFTTEAPGSGGKEL